MSKYRAEKSRFNDSWNIERQFPCINGLTAWFTVAVVHESDESELGYTEGAFGTAEERAKLIVDALNTASVHIHLQPNHTVERVGDCMVVSR